MFVNATGVLPSASLAGVPFCGIISWMTDVRVMWFGSNAAEFQSMSKALLAMFRMSASVMTGRPV